MSDEYREHDRQGINTKIIITFIIINELTHSILLIKKSGRIRKRIGLIDAWMLRAPGEQNHVDVQMNEQQHEERVPSLLFRIL